MPNSRATDPLATPTRIAVAGDWHANTRWARYAIQHADDEGADVVVHLGDFAYDFPSEFVAGVEDALAAVGTPLLWVDGNHDDHSRIAATPVGPNGLRQVSGHIWHLPRGFRWEWDGVRFLACGGAHSVDRQRRTPGVSWWAGEAITDDDVTACGTDPVDVLVAHDCPSGVTVPGLNGGSWPPLEILRANEHRDVLRRVVDATRPRFIWHGHYHRAYEATADLGYGPVRVLGLDCDGTDLAANVRVIDLAEL